MNKMLSKIITIVDELSDKLQANKKSFPSDEFIEAERSFNESSKQVNKELNDISSRIINRP